jgi:hypothetical protein
MPTSWTSPSELFQYAETGAESVHISWREDEFNNLLNSGLGSGYQSLNLNGVLEHISRSPKFDITNKTYFLRATGYQFANLPAVLSGIEFRLSARRMGRCADDTVQLCLNSELVGENQASISVDPIQVYGGENHMWATNLTLADIQDPLFGVVVRLRSHPHWPHRDSAGLVSLEIRIH